VNQNLSVQLSGPVIQSVIDGIQESNDARLTLYEFWSGLKISTAIGADGTLDFIGALAGFPRPLVPIDFFSLNVFHLSAAALWPQQSILTGLGSVYFPVMGGQLGSVFPSVLYEMTDSWYRTLIPLAAQLKYYGLTIYTIDLMASSTETTYLITFDGGTGPDINLTFNSDIGFQKLWLLQELFDKYATGTQVNVVNGIANLVIAITQGIGVEGIVGFEGAMVGAIDLVFAGETLTVLKDMMTPSYQAVAVREAVTVARG
jgi:hypothetical protein